MINNERLLKNFTTKESRESKESNIYDNRVSPLFPYDVIKKLKITELQLIRLHVRGVQDFYVFV